MKFSNISAFSLPTLKERSVESASLASFSTSTRTFALPLFSCSATFDTCVLFLTRMHTCCGCSYSETRSEQGETCGRSVPTRRLRPAAGCSADSNNRSEKNHRETVGFPSDHQSLRHNASLAGSQSTTANRCYGT